MSNKETGYKLTEKDINEINKVNEEEVKNDPQLQKLANMPSNNDKLERSPLEKSEKGEFKKVPVEIDPNTGEHIITGTEEADSPSDDETFEEMCERIQNSDININDDTPISEKEMIDYLANDNNNNFLNALGTKELSAEDMQQILKVTNRRMNKENFNVYKELPTSIQDVITKYMKEGGLNEKTNQYRAVRNQLAESIIDDFISSISIDRVQHDFNKELEDIFERGSKEISEEIIGYSEERNKKYREYAEKMEDEDKKKKLIAILDQIDDAYNLEALKEYSKNCKIKRFDLEKPNKYFDRFNNKYKDSPYKIYNIDMCVPALIRNINISDDEHYDADDCVAFLVAFCKQTLNMHPSVVLEHAYMYYLIYNIILIDMNKSDKTKYVSENFIKNIHEVMDNLRERNPIIVNKK